MDTLTIETVVLPTPVVVYLCFNLVIVLLSVALNLRGFALSNHGKEVTPGIAAARLTVHTFHACVLTYFLFLAGY